MIFQFIIVIMMNVNLTILHFVSQVALRRQQAQEETEAREIGMVYSQQLMHLGTEGIHTYPDNHTYQRSSASSYEDLDEPRK